MEAYETFFLIDLRTFIKPTNSASSINVWWIIKPSATIFYSKYAVVVGDTGTIIPGSSDFKIKDFLHKHP